MRSAMFVSPEELENVLEKNNLKEASDLVIDAFVLTVGLNKRGEFYFDFIIQDVFRKRVKDVALRNRVYFANKQLKLKFPFVILLSENVICEAVDVLIDYIDKLQTTFVTMEIVRIKSDGSRVYITG